MNTYNTPNDKFFLNALGIAFVLHLILLVALFIGLQWQSDNFALTAGPQVMRATALLNAPVKSQVPPAPLQTVKPQPKPVVEKPPSSPEKKTTPIKNDAATIAIQKQKVLEAKKEAEQKKADLAKAAATDKEQKREAAQQAQIMQGVVDKYKALILQAIGQNWIIPPKTNKKLSAELVLRLAPDGSVLSVKIVKSSGNSLLDESAVMAVQKSSPLPVPEDLQQFNAFRQINLTVKPDAYYIQGER